MRIVTEGLRYTYDLKAKFRHDALSGVDFTCEEGSFLGIIGKTGSGKSTFVQHLNGLIKIQKNSGNIFVGEYDLSAKNCNFNELRAKVGMVFQYPEYQLFAETVFDDVAFGLKNFRKGISSEDMEKEIRRALTAVGLDYDAVKDKSPFDFSGGQKRRIAIAGVIVTRPEILILDEPVAGLDPKGKEEFLALIHALHKDFVKTVVIISHDMDIVADNCDKVVVFGDGKIVLSGTPKEVFSNGELIESLGLELPLTAYLQERLKENGIIIDSDLTVRDFTEKVALIGGKL